MTWPGGGSKPCSVSTPETYAGSGRIAGGPGVAAAPASGPPFVATVRVAGHVAGSIQSVGTHAHRISLGFLWRALEWVDANARCTLSLLLFKDVGGELLLRLHLGVVSGVGSGGVAERCRNHRGGDE